MQIQVKITPTFILLFLVSNLIPSKSFIKMFHNFCVIMLTASTTNGSIVIG